MKLPRGLFVARGRIPGSRDSEAAIEDREKPGLRRHIGRVRARNAASPDDAAYRANGVSVFDRNAGMSELGGYLRSRDDR